MSLEGGRHHVGALPLLLFLRLWGAMQIRLRRSYADSVV